MGASRITRMLIAPWLAAALALTTAAAPATAARTAARPGPGTGQAGSRVRAQASARTVPAPIYGVTLDCGYLPGQDGLPGLRQLDSRLPEIIDSLRHLARKPTVRVVFDPGASPRQYIAPLRKLHRVAYVMGELLDSSHLAHFTTARYLARARAYFGTLGHLVDIWEIGNEVNGNWTGRPSTVAASVIGAYHLAAARGLRTAITFYLQAHQARRNQPFRWIAAHLPGSVRDGVDYALISYYDNDVRLRLTPIFAKLAAEFPHAKVGFGELGGDDTHSDRKFTIRHFYGLRVPGVRSYAGGYFYWYYCQDMVPYRGSGLWPMLNRKIARGWTPPPARPGRIAQIRTMPGPTLYGVTADNVARAGEMTASERHLPQMPATRIYFDVRHGPGYYRAAVDAIRRGSYIVGELLDSSDETKISIAAFRARIRSYLRAFGGKVDIWEIGNEVNGNWLGPYPKVAARLAAAYREVSARGLRTALTLYYNIGCGDGRSELSPVAFTRRYVPPDVRDQLDYVLLSYYEDDCHGQRPSVATWTSYLRKLHRLYPNALLGFGEIGMNNPATPKTLPAARSLIRHYYGLAIHYPYFIGGYFWWYYYEDCLPYQHKPLWHDIRTGFSREAAAIGGG